MTNREAFATALAVLGSTFDRKLSGSAIDGYWIALSGLTETEFAAATKRALMECRFMPSPSELLACSGRSRNVAADANEAWEAVRSAIDQHDYTTSVDFGSLVNAIIRNMGGWLRLCDLGRDALDVWSRKDFERLFVEFAAKDPATLRGDPHGGKFGGAPVRIEIGGKMPPLRIAAAPNAASAIVRELADAKSDTSKEFDMPNRPGQAPAIPPRPEKPKAAPMTAAEVDARKAEIAAACAV